MNNKNFCPECGSDLNNGMFSEVTFNEEILEAVENKSSNIIETNNYAIKEGVEKILNECDEYFIEKLSALYPEHEEKIREKNKLWLQRFTERENIVVEQTPIEFDSEKMVLQKNMGKIHSNRSCDSDCWCSDLIE